MAKQDLNIGTLANDGTGDTLRDGGTKVKANFDELYTALGGNTVQIAIPGSGVTNGQVLKYNASNSAFEPDTDTNVNTTYTVSAEVSGTDASIRLTGSDASTDNVNLVSGTGINIDRTDADNITINNTVTNTTYSTSIQSVTAGSKELRLSGSNSVNDDITITEGAGIVLTSSNDAQLTITSVSLQQFDFSAGDGTNYTVSGSGLLTAGENDPQLFVYRGHTYRFRHTIAANAHPLEIVEFGTSTAPAADYISSTNATRNLATTNDIITFTIPMNAATGNTYQYRCTAHPSNMLGTITVV
tara:strand:- start:117 stop:1016 length:900 start_codon:yes stop_codon:yes gene_type:complete